MTPDLAARKILCAAYLYYVLDANPIMTDEEYDALSVFVHDRWDELHEDRKFCCVDAGSTRASGAHFRYTVYAVYAAREAYWQKYKYFAPGSMPEKWQESDGRRYVTGLN